MVFTTCLSSTVDVTESLSRQMEQSSLSLSSTKELLLSTKTQERMFLSKSIRGWTFIVLGPLVALQVSIYRKGYYSISQFSSFSGLTAVLP